MLFSVVEKDFDVFHAGAQVFGFLFDYCKFRLLKSVTLFNFRAFGDRRD